MRKEIRTATKSYGRKSAVKLFDLMAREAEHSPVYAASFQRWLNSGSTVALRALSIPFGFYWNDLAFSNDVDCIDAAICNAKAQGTQAPADQNKDI